MSAEHDIGSAEHDVRNGGHDVRNGGHDIESVEHGVGSGGHDAMGGGHGAGVPRLQAQFVVARVKGRTAGAPAERSSRVARVNVQPVSV